MSKMYRAVACLVCLIVLPMIASAQFTNCTALPAHNTTTILDLHPNDITVMMAMGDSITTGFGVYNQVNESRGIAFSMGGDSGATTLANFFKFFSPSLLGSSLGTYPAQVCYGTNCPTLGYNVLDVNNAAKSGAMVVDMVSGQLTYLLRQINQNPYINVQQDWKVLTIMIGANDLCASCTFNLPYLEADEYENNLMGTLERVRQNMPRTFVNLVAGFNVSQAYELSLQDNRCVNISRPLFIQCDCLFQPDAGAIREVIDAHITQYNAAAQNAATYYQRKAYDNFAVVVQPFAMDTYLSELNSTFLSDLDCFHPSQQGHEAMAIALWNNMLTPAARKKTNLDLSDTPICPTSDMLLYTY